MRPFLLFCTLCIVVGASAQDQRYAQFFNAPLQINPALTGLMNDDIRVIAAYRNQWATVTVPYQTMSVSTDMNFLRGFSAGDFFGAGLFVGSDLAGSSKYRISQAQLSGAYSKAFDAEGVVSLSVGGQVGVVQQRIDRNALTFDNQFTGDGFNSNIGSGENLAVDSKIYPDVSAGAALYIVPSERLSFNLGAGAFHLNTPDVGFYGVQEELYRKMTVHAGADIGIDDAITILPRAYAMWQGPNQEITFGVLGRINFTPDADPLEGEWGQSLYLGTFHRVGDAQIANVRFDIGPFGLSLSYDFNMSTLKRASLGQGGPEVVVIYKSTFFQNDERATNGRVKCPFF